MSDDVVVLWGRVSERGMVENTGTAASACRRLITAVPGTSEMVGFG